MKGENNQMWSSNLVKSALVPPRDRCNDDADEWLWCAMWRQRGETRTLSCMYTNGVCFCINLECIDVVFQYFSLCFCSVTSRMRKYFKIIKNILTVKIWDVDERYRRCIVEYILLPWETVWMWSLLPGRPEVWPDRRSCTLWSSSWGEGPGAGSWSLGFYLKHRGGHTLDRAYMAAALVKSGGAVIRSAGGMKWKRERRIR